MKVIAKTDEYTIYQKRNERYGVKDANRNWINGDAKVAILLDMVGIYRDQLQLDVMVINTYNAILAVAPDNSDALNALADKYESMNRWNDLIGILSRQAQADPRRSARLLAGGQAVVDEIDQGAPHLLGIQADQADARVETEGRVQDLARPDQLCGDVGGVEEQDHDHRDDAQRTAAVVETHLEVVG